MGFLDSYKRLEKLCGEVMDDDRRLSAYIDAMMQTPGNYYVRGWTEDLKKLKHYRWVRNKITHEPGCEEYNMCEPGDALWLDRFYERIMNGTDPLALYRQATAQHVEKPRSPDQRQPVSPQQSRGGEGVLWIAAVIVIIAMVAFLLLSGNR